MASEGLLQLSGATLCACVTWAHTTGVLLDCNQIRVLRQSLRLLRSRQLDFLILALSAFPFGAGCHAFFRCRLVWHFSTAPFRVTIGKNETG